MICRRVAPMASRSAVCPRRATARASSRLATLAQAISRTNAADGQQDLQAAAVLFFHLRDARARRHHINHLLGKIADHVGHPVGGIAGIVLQPLPQHSGETRSHSGNRSSRPQAANHAQPRGEAIDAAGRRRHRSAVPAVRESRCRADRRAEFRRKIRGARRR